MRNMKFERRFGRRKKSNPKRGLFLILLLAIVLFLWFKAADLLSGLL